MIEELPMLAGDVEAVQVAPRSDGSRVLVCRGWLVCRARRLMELRFGVHGSPMTTAEQALSQEAFKNCPDVSHALESGFRVEIPLSPAAQTPESLYFLASLTPDLTLAGSFPVPTGIVTREFSVDGHGAAAPLSEYDRRQLLSLAHFTAHGGRLPFTRAESPEVSIVVVVHKRPERLLACLQSIRVSIDVPYELIIVDNASGDPTDKLLRRVDGARILRNEVNEHFIRGSNQGAAAAAGTYLLFLNSDVEVFPGAIRAAVDCLRRSERVGAVGARLIFPQGTLQEAGSIIFNDGSTAGYGRGDDPNASAYLFERNVDYCSAAFLCTPARLFRSLGGFAECFSPAYYEDADYCMRLAGLGYKTRFLPQAAVVHAEHSSSPARSSALELQRRNRAAFFKLHETTLASKPSAAAPAVNARHTGPCRGRVLLVDDTVPLQVKGSGLPRTSRLIHALSGLGYQVTFLPSQKSFDATEDVSHELPRDVEVIREQTIGELVEHLGERAGYYDLIWICRPHTLERFAELRPQLPKSYQSVPVVFDVEAMYSLRELAKLQLVLGEPVRKEDRDSVVSREARLAAGATVVVTVNELEADEFRGRGRGNVQVLSHWVPLNATDSSAAERHTLLTVGPVYEPETPNADALQWFVTRVHPSVVQQLPAVSPPFVCAGYVRPDIEERLTAAGNGLVRFVGPRKRLAEHYEQCRVFVAPTRFCSGISLKTLEAAAHGVPIVATPIVAEQLGWKHRQELLIAETPTEFATRCVELFQDEHLWQHLRIQALNRIYREYSEPAFLRSLKSILQSALP